MTEKRFTQKDEDDWEILDRNKHFAYAHSGYQAEKIIQELNELVETNRELYKENKELKIRNKGKQAFIDKQDKIIKLLYNQCKDFKEILDDSNITYPIDERLNKFFEEGVKL